MKVSSHILRRLEETAAGRMARPGTREELARWVEVYAGLHMPERGMCAGHCSPLDYLAHSFFELPTAEGEGSDVLVWACRSGGKTMMGAVATLLDLLFKPGAQVRILGGSLEQSDRMYGYLRGLFAVWFEDQLAGRATRRRLRLKNGSAVEVLAQSEAAVRGQRVQKLRCDEVELFDRAVWTAAQLTTRTMAGTQVKVRKRKGGKRGEEAMAGGARGAVEALSTMHEPGGLMQELMGEAGKAGGRKVFAWCVWDVIGKCPPERACGTCPLWRDCQGRAKEADGFVPVEEVIAMQGRVSRGAWEREMLCHPPRFEDAVFGRFERERHMAAWDGGRALKGEVVRVGERELVVEELIAGVDFGHLTFVCLWVAICRDERGRVVAWVVDEWVGKERTVEENVRSMREREATRGRWEPVVVFCDKAGQGRNSQTGWSDMSVVRAAGFNARWNAMKIEPGIGVIRQMMDPADEAASRLLIDPRCVGLSGAMAGYRRGKDGEAVKDGVHDHLIDALRYALVGREKGGFKVEVRRY